MRFKCPPAYNHLGISEHDRRPQEIIERERRIKEQEEKRKRDAYLKMLTDKLPEKLMWQPCHIDRKSVV